MDKSIEPEEFGPNSWLVDDMYQQYMENPASVGDQWREFFEDYQPHAPAPRRAQESVEKQAPAPPEPQRPPPNQRRRPRPTSSFPREPSLLRGVAARIAENMEASLEVPTATSVRSIPAKLLEENRRIINRYLGQRQGGKVSFTHLIGFAIVRGLEARPAMKSSYMEVNGQPYLIQHKHVNFGLAVDVEKKDGSRVLLVPNIKDADDLDFAGFWRAYEDLIKKVRGEQARARGLRRHDRHPDEPRHGRDRALGAAPDDGPGPHRRYRGDPVPA